MGQIKWYKRDPTAALEGMAALTLEERGALITVIDLIYAHDGKIDDNERFIAGWLRADVRVWRRIRNRLISLDKLYVNGPFLRNARADREVEEAIGRIRNASEAGLISAAKRTETRSIRNVLATTPVDRSLQLSTATKNKNLTYLSSENPAARAREEVSEAGESGDLLPLRRSEPWPPKQPSDVSLVELDDILARKRLQAKEVPK